MRLSDEQIHQYQETGFFVVPGLFDTATAQQMIQHYMERRAEGPKPGDSGGTTDHHRRFESPVSSNDQHAQLGCVDRRMGDAGDDVSTRRTADS